LKEYPPHPEPLPLVERGDLQEGRKKDEKIKRLKIRVFFGI
jgi:hypothetical protein